MASIPRRSARASALFVALGAGALACANLLSLDDVGYGSAPPEAGVSDAGAPPQAEAGEAPDARDSSAPEEAGEAGCIVPGIDPMFLGDAVQVDASYGFTCALRENGTVVCWGDNSDG